MTTATHALCPRCQRYEQVIWTPIKIAEVRGDGAVGEFEGLEMRCRVCQFEITNVGVVRQTALDAA